MELTEVVSPSVAVPVLCVLVCAFFVFAFGFKSPAQPPSFDVFEDESKKRKGKKSKGSKSQSNGHALTPQGETSASVSSKPTTSPKATKQAAKTQPTPTKVKAASSATSTESQKKSKKQAVKEEKPVQVKDVQDDIDASGWHTVPKKDKKTKRKDAPEKADSPVREEIVVAAKSELSAAAAAVSVEPTTADAGSAPASPQEQRAKKKKDKKPRKGKEEESGESASSAQPTAVEAMAIMVDEKPAAPEKVTKETVPEPAPPAQDESASIEIQIKEAMETNIEETGQVAAEKRRNKKKRRPVAEDDDFVIPQSALAPEPAPVVSLETELGSNIPLSDNTDALTAKVPKKDRKKKDRSKRGEEKPAEAGGDGASSRVESSLSQTAVSQSDIKTDKGETSPSSPATSQGASGDGPVQPQAAIFDELGGASESWTEAKPKSKKKKARRAD